jgi:hypothetical protein
MVEAGGVGIFSVIENTQVIDFATRQKPRILRNCAQLERIWNAGFSSLHPSRKVFQSELSDPDSNRGVVQKNSIRRLSAQSNILTL